MSDLPEDTITVKIEVLQARDLVAKDRSLILQKKTTSDPYVKLTVDHRKIGKTKTYEKTLDPVWNESFKYQFKAVNPSSEPAEPHQQPHMLKLDIWDHDTFKDDDPMGGVFIPLNVLDMNTTTTTITKWYPVKPRMHRANCANATGELQVRLSFEKNVHG